MARAVQVAKSELRQKLLMCSPGLLWLAIMFVKPHKVFNMPTTRPSTNYNRNPKLLKVFILSDRSTRYLNQM